MSKRPPTRHEIEEVIAEGRHRFGWLRSRLLGLPWPREGVCACGRPSCEVCEAAAAKLPGKQTEGGPT
jgi:hypothetical protein